MKTPDRPRPPAKGLLPAILAAAMTAAASIGTAFLADRQVWFLAPIAVLVLAGGLVLTCILAVVGRWRLSRAKALADGYADGTATERATHRRFLARLDHELKNPITAIRAAVATGDPAQYPVLDQQAARLGTLVSDLRKLADLEVQPIEFESVNMEQVSRDAAADLGDHLDTAGDRREIHLAFPRAPWPLPQVRGDPDLLYLAVYNLLSNAAKYSPPGSRIEVRGYDEEGHVVIEVADVGMGIPANEIDHVLDELARGSQVRGIPGSGLGLSLVRVILSRHNGNLTLRSRQGEGTSARLWLPAK